MTKTERLVLASCVALFFVEAALVAYQVRCWTRIEACGPCLPAGLELSTEFAPSPETIKGSLLERKTTTVRKALFRIGAYCRNGQIYDRWGRKVFFRWALDWGAGMSPKECWMLQDKERDEVVRLKKEGSIIILMWQRQVSF